MGLIPSALMDGGGYDVPNSGAFAVEQSDYLSRTPSVAGNRKTFTLNKNIKRVKLGVSQFILAAGSTVNDRSYIYINASDQIQVINVISGIAYGRRSDAVFRDIGSYYDINVVVDTTQSTAVDRISVSVNDVSIPLSIVGGGGDLALNSLMSINNTVPHHIGSAGYQVSNTLDGYLSEVHFIDGQALTPDNFAETDPVTGQWNPKKYTGTYGTNGFYLDFQNGANLGEDKSGNGNDFTNNGVTQSTDTPTDNHPIFSNLYYNTGRTITNAGLEYATPTTNLNLRPAVTFAFPKTGKWYWELQPTLNGNISFNGICNHDGSKYDTIYASTGDHWQNGSNIGAFSATLATNDIQGFAWNADTRVLEFFKNNTSQGTLSLTGNYDVDEDVFVLVADGSTPSGTVVTGYFTESSWAYSAPTGYKALSSKNLPEPIIKDPTKYFKALAYDDGAGAKVLGFQPDLVWMKSRGSAFNHKLVDSVRGATKSIESNTTAVEATEATGLTSFDTNGFTVGADTDYSDTTGLGMIAWAWKEGITEGFDIVQYSGDNTANRNISHSLGVAPELAIIARLDSAEDRFVWHQGLTGNDYFLKLNDTPAQTNVASPFGTGNWSSTQFMVDNDATNNTNATGTNNYIAYLFTSIEGFSKFGSYTGNGSADGTFVYCGFRPAFLMVKRTDVAGESWEMYDSGRDLNNPLVEIAYANVTGITNPIASNAQRPDLVSNGFKCRSGNGGANASGGTYIYMAFAESPFKYSRAR